jgi:hypothetical protein
MTYLDQGTAADDALPSGHPEPDLCMGHVTNGMRKTAEDIFKTWMFQPHRRCEFGEREIYDIQETVIGLNSLLRQAKRSANNGQT